VGAVQFALYVKMTVLGTSNAILQLFSTPRFIAYPHVELATQW